MKILLAAKAFICILFSKYPHLFINLIIQQSRTNLNLKKVKVIQRPNFSILGIKYTVTNLKVIT